MSSEKKIIDKIVADAVAEKAKILEKSKNEADAVINVGDCNEFVILPKMDRIIGDEQQITCMSGGAEESIQEDGSMRVSLSAIMGSVIGQGTLKMSSYVY